MAVNTAPQFSADIEAYIADETLPLARKQLVVYQFGDPLELPKGRGTTYTATRYLRIPLPFQPLSEGVPPIGETMSIQQVNATAQQWGDKVTITDVAELTIKHPLFKKATEIVGLQVAETLERNTFNTLASGTQVNYVNSRGARASLVTGDVLNPSEVIRAYAMMFNLGAPRYNGDEMTDTKLQADAGGARASSNPRTMPHYVAVCHPFVAADLKQDSRVSQAWSYSDINRIYNYEVGEWNGIRFCESNMVPSFTGVALVAVNPAATGNLATGTYTVQVTGSDNQNQFESRIYQTTTAVVTGPNGSITLTTPNTANFTYTVYVSAAGLTTLANVGLSTSGPISGPMTGQAVQLPPNTLVTITGLGAAQTPPSAPGTGITVYPTFIFGRGAYGQVILDNVKFTYLKDADKGDPLNQLRVVGWKAFYGTLIENQNFFMRIESTSAFNATFG
jgi:N4-gp56 family major capsid protein